MSAKARVLVWTPRVLGLAMALFVSVFALDAFGDAQGFWPTVGALAIHLIPAAIAGLVLAIAWRWKVVGGLLFIAAGVAYAVTVPSHPSWILVIGGPLIVVGVLFVVSGAPFHAGATR